MSRPGACKAQHFRDLACSLSRGLEQGQVMQPGIGPRTTWQNLDKVEGFQQQKLARISSNRKLLLLGNPGLVSRGSSNFNLHCLLECRDSESQKVNMTQKGWVPTDVGITPFQNQKKQLSIPKQSGVSC